MPYRRSGTRNSSTTSSSPQSGSGSGTPHPPDAVTDAVPHPSLGSGRSVLARARPDEEYHRSGPCLVRRRLGAARAAIRRLPRPSGKDCPMRALLFTAYGGPEVLEWADAPAPHPGPGQIRITVRAASVNPIDWKTFTGAMAGGQPKVGIGYLGYDAAGVVDEVGEGVTGVSVGDDVLAAAQHVVAHGHTGDPLTDLVHHAGGVVAQVADTDLGLAAGHGAGEGLPVDRVHAGRPYCDPDLPRAGVWRRSVGPSRTSGPPYAVNSSARIGQSFPDGRGSRRIAARAAPSRLRTKQGPERWYSSSGRARASTDRPEPKLGCGTASVTASRMLAVRRDCKSRILQVKVRLREVRPSVWRWVLIPGEATLVELHEVLQIAMR